MAVVGILDEPALRAALEYGRDLHAKREQERIRSKRVSRMTDLQITLVGAVGEHALSQVTGYPLKTPMARTVAELFGDDVGPWQNKATTCWGGHLMVPAGAEYEYLRKPDAAYALTYVDLNDGTFAVNAWCYGHMFLDDAHMKTELYGRPLPHPAYVINPWDMYDFTGVDPDKAPRTPRMFMYQHRPMAAVVRP